MKPINTFDVVVIGAGMAGITAAARLRSAGWSVCVLEKSHNPGGRMATRDKPEGCWDHGAQYFTAKSVEFRAQVQQWLAEGSVAQWKSPIAVWDGEQLSASRSRERFIGMPRMKSPLLDMAEGLHIVYNALVTQITHRADDWIIEAANSVWCAHRVIIALPAPQTRALLPTGSEAYLVANSVEMEPCLALMVQASKPLGLPFAAAFVNEGILGWVAHNNRKPGRAAGEHYLLHATAEWSRLHLDASPEWVQSAMLAEFNRLLAHWLPGNKIPGVYPRYFHRWRFAKAPSSTAHLKSVWPELGLALAGDWLGDGRIEAAYCSGLAAANALLNESVSAAVSVTDTRPNIRTTEDKAPF
ncbi:NAD(P)/FAD-dependent oxidoreductase [Cellvibrio sp. pealriver]|uniref:NAD(P)/FAD-dependent oxidoreductase n=1 Tax=Cellvibrio sp. pealriver TaxID=1622269 RepID=UPI00066FD436|nr:FAD-dependent oxidoreductase [Cellvibrio sp. pealriver]